MRRLLPEPGGPAPAGLTTEDVVEAYRLPPGRALRVNFIASPDGSTTVDGKSRGLQMPGDLLVFRILRALGDAVLVGAGTAAAEGYGPMEDDPVVIRLREDLGRPPTAPIVVVSRRASVPLDTRLIGGRVPSICLTCEAADPERRAALAAAGLEVLVCGEDDVDLAQARRELEARGWRRILAEGGPTLFGDLVSAGVVDELCLSLTPFLVGPGQITRILAGPGSWPELERLELAGVLEEDGALFLRYRLAAR